MEVWEKRARRDLNPGPPAPEAGAHEASSKLGEGVTPETHDSRFKYSWTPVIIGIRVSRVVVESNKVVLEFDDPDRLSKFIELLRLLGVTNNVEKKEVRIRYEDGFRLYLEKDRQLEERTTRDYLNYLKKLNGKVINYDLYLRVSHNKWLVKTIRLYLDYLYKKEEISFEDYQKLKSIFKVKKRSVVTNHKIYEEDLITALHHEDLKEPELLLLNVLLYSGVRFTEAVKLLNEFSEDKLECFNSFCRYAVFWLRGRKRCDWIYLPKELVDLLKEWKGYFKNKKINSLTRYFEKKYNVDLKLFRKFFYRVCRDVASKEICDFYQSRISGLSIGDLHYDNLLQRADQEYPKVVRRINDVIKEDLMSMSDGIPNEEAEIITSDEVDEFGEDYSEE